MCPILFYPMCVMPRRVKYPDGKRKNRLLTHYLISWQCSIVSCWCVVVWEKGDSCSPLVPLHVYGNCNTDLANKSHVSPISLPLERTPENLQHSQNPFVIIFICRSLFSFIIVELPSLFPIFVNVCHAKEHHQRWWKGKVIFFLCRKILRKVHG